MTYPAMAAEKEPVLCFECDSPQISSEIPACCDGCEDLRLCEACLKVADKCVCGALILCADPFTCDTCERIICRHCYDDYTGECGTHAPSPTPSDIADTAAPPVEP